MNSWRLKINLSAFKQFIHMVLHKYKITWQIDKIEGVKFVTTFMRDFGYVDEVERVLEIFRMLSEHPSYKKVKILKIEEVE